MLALHSHIKLIVSVMQNANGATVLVQMLTVHQLVHNQDATLLVHVLGLMAHVHHFQNAQTTHQTPMSHAQNMEVDVIQQQPQMELELIVKIELLSHLDQSVAQHYHPHQQHAML